MHIAQQRHGARVVELEGTLLSLWPGTQVVAKLLVASDRNPKYVVGNAIAVEELHGRALLRGQDMRLKH